MPNQVISSVENNFTKGLVTEFTGLNFPENAATDTDNCEYTVVGNVLRRYGINYETNFATSTFARANQSVSYFKWLNAGGDGSSQILVLQVGSTLHFYKYSNATVASPMSTTLLSDTVSLTSFIPAGSTLNPFDYECQYAEGNGYLLVSNPATESFYVSYLSGVTPAVSASLINIQIRDFAGVVEANIPDSQRPSVNTNFHNYNLQNQGWLNSTSWSATSSTGVVIGLGSKSFTVAAGLPVVVGNSAIAYGNVYYPFGGLKYQTYLAGIVTAYAGTTLTINVTSYLTGLGDTSLDWAISPYTTSGQINTFHTAVGLYPSNSDVWWYFKDNTGAFNPSATVANTSLGSGPAPKGFYILDAFNQRRDLVSGLTAPVYTTPKRPRTNAWFAGRAWFTGVDDTQLAAGYYYPYTWTENIYFSQIAIAPAQFGRCYQTNDPTSENLFGLLPSDGGVITIQGSGPIYKLFPIQNGMLVFAGNGIWFLTGSQGIGFTANDYTITKISSVKSFSSTSFVNVLGLPYFWNEEGIYTVSPAKQGGLTVDSITVGTILSFYENIPISSRRYARGDYNPTEYVIQWTYKSTEATGVTDRYSFDKILNFNTYNKAFYPYTIPITPASVQGVVYITGVGGTDAPPAEFKYITSAVNAGTYNFTFSDLNDTTYVDWAAITPTNFTSYFVTGYKLHGQAQRRFQLGYIYVYSNSLVSTAYKIQGLWDYATSGNSGRWSMLQTAYNTLSNFGKMVKRHRIRGQGLVLQIKIKSVDGQPFDIAGWSTYENMNTGV